MAEKEVKIERKYVDVDTTVKNVLKWAQEGHTLVFLSKPDLFLKLNAEVLDELPKAVRTSYRLAEAEYTKNAGLFKDDVLDILSSTVEYGRPSEQLHVERDASDPNTYKWVRPEQIKTYGREGWNVVTTEKASQRGLRDTGYHMVGAKELILMEIPKTKYAEIKAMKDKRHTQLFEAETESIRKQAYDLGMKLLEENSSEDIHIPFK